MSLRIFLRSLGWSGRERFAIAVGTTIGHLNNVTYKTKTASAALARQIEIESNGAVYRWELRPDDWHLIWPELADHPDAPPLPSMAPASAALTAQAS